MLARIAHELFWLGRNLGRAEHTARMLDGVFHADLQGRPEDPSGVTLSWDSLLAIMGSSMPNGGTASRDVTIAALTHDPENVNSVASCVGRARNGARALRDVISAEMWEAINTFHLELGDQRVSSGPYAFVSYVKARCALFWGVAARTMLRDEAHAFLDAGGRFESADMVMRMLRVALPPPGVAGADGEPSPTRDGQALALLQAVGGFQAYRRAVPAPPNAAPVASFLLFQLSYPDSVAASINAARHSLSVADRNPRASEPVLRLSRLLADLEFRGRIDGDGAGLVEACEIVGRELALTDRDIAERYFGGTATTDAMLRR
jgi:uncharacterized alpha-E superfamily protein